MSIFLQLVKMTTASVEPSTQEKMKSKTFNIVMAIVVCFLIFIPVALFVGFIVYALTSALAAYDDRSIVPLGLSLMLHIVSAFSLVFGFNVILSVFYFSSDLDYLLPLPISPIKIVGAKFTSTMLSENFMEGILVLSAVVGFLIGNGFNGSAANTVVGILSSVIGMVTFPILALSYCAVICMLLMYFTKFIRNKDTVSKVTALSTIILLAVLVVLMNLSGGFDPNVFAEQMINGDLGLFNVLDKIFFQVRYLSAAIAGDVLSLIIYILINAASVAIVLLLSSKLYIKAVVSLSGGQGKTKVASPSEIDKKIHSASHLYTYFKKELIILFRTPAYLSNCVGINLIWPVFIYLFVMLQKQNNFLGNYLDGIKNGEAYAILNLTLVVFGVSVILTALNCLSSSAVTREGKHFEVMKYMPVDLMTQLNSKALVSIMISGVGLVIYIISAFIVFGISPALTTYCTALSLVAVVFTTYLGIYVDSINPKLVWDDEINALRGNYNVFFNMAISLILTAAVCAGLTLLMKLNVCPLWTLLTALMLIGIILMFVSYGLCITKGVKNLEKLE